MEDIIKQTLTAIPQYLIDFFKLLSAPRQFPLERLPNNVSNTKDSLTEALKFILISYALIVILGSIKNETANAMKLLGAVAVSNLVNMSLLVFAIFLAWKIFGSKRPFLDYFIIYSYQFGVVFIIIGIFGIICDGYLKATDKELLDSLAKVNAGTMKFDINWMNNFNYQIALGIFFIGWVISAIWGLVSWGAFRIINDTRRLKSIGVMCLAAFFSWIAFAISFLITKGIAK